jgi:molybdate transport repressor ModE-like protein
MSAPRQRRSTYKEVRLQQLRSFTQTARLGSFAAAASALGVAQPTVWEQVHALEREFGAKLVEAHGRGCRLTDDGRLLLSLADPLVAGLDSLKRHFQEARDQATATLTVATTPRIMVEDLPDCVLDFETRWPSVRLTFRETRDEDVPGEVDSGAADLGLVPLTESQRDNPRLAFEPGYLLDMVLVTPLDHPLAKRKTLTPTDLTPYPLVNSPGAFSDPALVAVLRKLGLFASGPRRVEAFFAGTIRKYVELGFGIGLIPQPATRRVSGFHQRVMSHHFGQLTAYFIWRNGALRSPAAIAFAETIKTRLNSAPPR